MKMRARGRFLYSLAPAMGVALLTASPAFAAATNAPSTAEPTVASDVDGPPVAPAVAIVADSPPPPKRWSETIKISGHVEGGLTLNASDPPDSLNFGHLFTDRAGEPLLNQAMLTVERPIDSSSKSVDIGFRVQGMYGSDARYTHFLGEFDDLTSRRNQFDIVEANIQAHLPILTSGGVDIKAGQFVTLEGVEVIDATGNFFYSHTYLFNFGIPLKHTGIMITTHVSKVLDIYTGITSGVNTSLFKGDNNGAPSFHGGFGLNLLGGNLTILATTSIGPEIPRGTPGVRPNHDLRYLNDVTIIWKINPKLTSSTDVNYIRDDGFNVSGGGVAQYFTYAVNSEFAIGIRGEVWRDSNGFFVGAFPGNRDFVNAEKGLPATVIGGGNTTYGAVTFGVNIKPPMPKGMGTLLVRPEVRYDASLNNTTPFAAGTKDHQLTVGADVILSF